MDGAKNLQPRPGVRGMQPWETISLEVGGKEFKVTGVSTKHVLWGEYTRFFLRATSFDGPLQVTVDSKQAAQLEKDLDIELTVPIQFKGCSIFSKA
ncbi:Zn-dependent hydrolases of the beta-lactamase [Schizosaccharomyces osmophilus]|uniref:Zn-dependent hydrolases of the beta-lactamase n=1 Tax=Schizosaccharomyces osmophilus TaxID=2545709 RepID=A0AAF0AWD5_9SCHI|nr:Zn-dependent hydrolases of the beta-lactamase [Schizosaccharomyces osmophilus]WBW73398.1 Zn-dependent hydrolases of the beta-lactamase [Schizosaccharomyces osmophilus]